MDNWKTVPLGSLGIESRNAFATGPFGSAVSAKNFRESGVPMIRGSNLSNDVGVRLDESEMVFVSDELASRFSRSVAAVGDLIFTCWGTIGQIGLIDVSARHSRYIVSNKQMKMTPDTSRVSPLFLYYYLSQPSMIALVRGQSIGSSVPGFNLGQLKTIPVTLPPLGEQQRIVDVLGALDEKIGVNHRILSLQDRCIRTAYDALHGDIRALGSVAKAVTEQRQPADISPQTQYLGLEHLPRRLMWASAAGTAAQVTSVKWSFERHDTLFGKLRPYFHKVISAGASGVCSTDIIVVRAHDPRLAGYVLAACSCDETVRACVASSDGTRMPRTSWKDLSSVAVVWPGEERAASFSSEVLTMADLGHAVVNESRRLAAARDELLPLLMSGRIQVRDAEKVVEEVV